MISALWKIRFRFGVSQNPPHFQPVNLQQDDDFDAAANTVGDNGFDARV